VPTSTGNRREAWESKFATSVLRPTSFMPIVPLISGNEETFVETAARLSVRGASAPKCGLVGRLCPPATEGMQDVCDIIRIQLENLLRKSGSSQLILAVGHSGFSEPRTDSEGAFGLVRSR
jgi:hypothetical protein